MSFIHTWILSFSNHIILLKVQKAETKEILILNVNIMQIFYFKYYHNCNTILQLYQTQPFPYAYSPSLILVIIMNLRKTKQRLFSPFEISTSENKRCQVA